MLCLVVGLIPRADLAFAQTLAWISESIPLPPFPLDFVESSEGGQIYSSLAQEIMMTAGLSLVFQLPLFGLLYLLFAPIAAFSVWLLRKQKIAFGDEGFLGAITTRIKVSRVPHEVSQSVRSPLPMHWAHSLLRHSAFYGDAEVLAKTCETIVEGKITPNSDVKPRVGGLATVSKYLVLLCLVYVIVWLHTASASLFFWLFALLGASGPPDGPIF